MGILMEKSIIIFDFDGVILESMDIRDLGFREIFNEYDEKKVENLIEYHRINGGLSRFHKIEYFYTKILKKNINECEIKKYAEKFSEIMKRELVNSKYLIGDCINFIKNNSENYSMHIASGSEEIELKYICDKLDIKKYFKSIHGSPTHKNDLVRNIIKDNNYDDKNIVLIGDSINDYEAALKNNITFIAYNNSKLKNIDSTYVELLSQI